MSGDVISVREARLDDPADGAAIVEIIDSYARGPGGQNAALDEAAKRAMVPGLRAHPMATVLLGLRGERRVGVAVCVESFSTFAGRPSPNLHDFAVLPGEQGGGVGTRLLERVESLARERGCCKVTLEVHGTNEAAQRLYRRFGFGPWEPPTYFVSRPL